MTQDKNNLDLFEYRDYRLYLKDWYLQKKSSRFAYSYQKFSLQAGFSSPNFLKLVMEGKRNISEESISKFIKVLKLNTQEADYFYHLVLVNQTTDVSLLKKHEHKLESMRKTQKPKELTKDHSELFDTWYHFVVREVVICKDCNGSPEWISAKLNHLINPEKVTQSLALLLKHGFLLKNEKGHYEQSAPIASLSGKLDPARIAGYHRHVLVMSQDLLAQKKARGTSEKIDVSSLTLGISKNKIPQLRSHIEKFRKDVLALVADETEPDEVILLNMQLVPVT